ncbi:MAG: tetratricopeptide repeat protein [Planctomycetaceae bacterium]|nr:tetratricopeptide repeat protein [Planctomycetaceae bacterium]
MSKRGPESRRPGTVPPRLYGLALVLLVLLVYGQTLSFDFVKLDDQQYVTENEHVLQGLSPASIRWAFDPSGYAANWHPLVWLSLMLDVELYGTWPGGFHLTAVLLHAANTLLLVALLGRLTGETGKSFVVAGLFAVHPLHVESVAWVTERKDMLSTFFGLLSLTSYAHFLNGHRPAWYLAAWFCLLFSLMSKQMFVTLPCLLLLLDFWPLQRMTSTVTTRSLLRLIGEKAPFAALSAVFCFVALWTQTVGEAVQSWERIPLDRRLSNAVVSYVMYLSQTFWPVNLAVFYPYSPTARSWWEVAACLVLLAGITAGAWLQRQRRPYLLTGWLWYLGTLLPVIGIIQVGDQARADRYMYFPLVGVLIAATWLTADVIRWCFQSPRVAPVFAAVVLMVSSALAWNQTRYWRNSISLFTHTLQVTDDNWLAHATLAAALMDAPEQSREAERHLRESLRIRPNNPIAHYNLALVLSDQGDLAQANSHFRQALVLKPDHFRARLLLCLNLKRLGQREELADELARFDALPMSLPAEVRSALDTLRSP